MSDITPADALRELGDDQAEYAAAAAKKLGLPESVEYVEMRTEYGWAAPRGFEGIVAFARREDAEAMASVYGRVVVREVITTAWREVSQ